MAPIAANPSKIAKIGMKRRLAAGGDHRGSATVRTPAVTKHRPDGQPSAIFGAHHVAAARSGSAANPPSAAPAAAPMYDAAKGNDKTNGLVCDGAPLSAKKAMAPSSKTQTTATGPSFVSRAFATREFSKAKGKAQAMKINPSHNASRADLPSVIGAS
jgi:hypothetical protein